jgi:hypothetical protein
MVSACKVQMVPLRPRVQRLLGRQCVQLAMFRTPTARISTGAKSPNILILATVSLIMLATAMARIPGAISQLPEVVKLPLVGTRTSFLDKLPSYRGHGSWSGLVNTQMIMREKEPAPVVSRLLGQTAHSRRTVIRRFTQRFV